MCHMCHRSCGSAPGQIKSHYNSEHGLSVSVSWASAPKEAQLPPTPASPVTGDSSMDEDDPVVPLDVTSLAVWSLSAEVKEGTPDSGSEDDEWETESAFSDSSEEFVEGDDDDVVPSFFTFSTPLDGDHPMSDEQPPEPLPETEETPSSPSVAVYGSESMYSYSSFICDVLLTQTVSGLSYDQLLSNFGYALNQEVKAVICTGCHRGVPVDMLITHSRAHHKGRQLMPSKDYTKASQRLSSLGYRISKDEKYHQPPGRKPVDGLEVLRGFLCPLQCEDGTSCHRVFLSPRTFSRHVSDHHIRPKPEAESCVSNAQTLFSQGGLQLYFSVDPSLSNMDASSASVYASAVKMFESLPKAKIPAPNNDKDRASIDWFTRWPELLQDYVGDQESMHFLKSLVSFPESGSDPDWLVKLCDHGTRWWNDAEAAHINCTDRASIMLKSHQR
jgi:hypothetical protein